MSSIDIRKGIDEIANCDSAAPAVRQVVHVRTRNKAGHSYRYGSEARKYHPDFIVVIDDGHGELARLLIVVLTAGTFFVAPFHEAYRSLAREWTLLRHQLTWSAWRYYFSQSGCSIMRLQFSGSDIGRCMVSMRRGNVRAARHRKQAV